MIFVGVDPGKEGGIVAINELEKIVGLWKMPLIKAAKGRDEFDLPGICALVSKVIPALPDPARKTVFFVEKQQPLPPKMGGTIANFNRGASYYTWKAALTALGVSFEVVRAQEWQGAMFASAPRLDTAAASLLVAGMTWPDVDFRRSDRAKKPDDGLTDAALIGLYGKRHRIKDVLPRRTCGEVHPGQDVFHSDGH